MHIKTSLPPDPPPLKSTTPRAVSSWTAWKTAWSSSPSAALQCPVTRWWALSLGATAFRPPAGLPQRGPPPAGRSRRRAAGSPVSWGRSEQDLYQTTLDISAKDRPNLFLDVAAALSAAKIRVDTLTAKGMPDGFALVSVVISIRDREAWTP